VTLPDNWNGNHMAEGGGAYFAPASFVTRSGGFLPDRPGYWRPVRTDVMRCVLKPSQCIRPT
jgi:hypothetical protein